MYGLLYRFEECDEKLYHLAPVCGLRNHFITIDTKILYYLLKSSNLVNVKIEDFYSNSVKYYHWNKIFKVPKHTNSREFDYMVDTDGVSACFHFEFLVQEFQSKLDYKFEAKDKFMFDNCRVIAIDPGRNNIVYGVERLPDGSDKVYKLTRREYYAKTGIKQANLNTEKWNKEIQHITNLLSEIGGKTAKSVHWNQYIQIIKDNYDVLWNHYTQSKWARQRFHLHIMKNKTLDTFFDRFNLVQQNGQTVRSNQQLIVAYGDASFNPNGRCELSVPTNKVYKTCKRFHQTIAVDEFRTSIICNHCNDFVTPVQECCKCYDENEEKEKNSVKEIRGLRWCNNTMCRKFLNRDKNAALNILQCFFHRPQIMMRDSPIRNPKFKPLTLFVNQSVNQRISEVVAS
jgi:hypothetical protein